MTGMKQTLRTSTALLAVALALPLMAGTVLLPRPAQAQATDARELLLLCQGRSEDSTPELDLAQCSAYLRGFLDRVLQEQVDGGKPEFCAPKARISAQTAATALTRMAFREPAALDEPAAEFLTLALKRAFPCDMPSFDQAPVDAAMPANPVSIQPTPISPPPATAPAPAAASVPPASAGRPPAATPVPAQLMAHTPQQASLPPATPAVGAPGTVGPVRNLPGSRLTQHDGMAVTLPPRTAPVQSAPLETAPTTTTRPSLYQLGAGDHTPAGLAAQVPQKLYGAVGSAADQ